MSETAQSDHTEHEARKQRERPERGKTGVRDVWLDEPKPLFDASNVRVWGVATDAAPDVMNVFGGPAQASPARPGG